MRHALFAAALLLAAASAAHADRTTLNFDGDWRFFQGNPPAPAPAQTLNGNYAPIDPPSFAFKDDTWRKVDLPHDWSIEGPFAENNATGAAGAFLPSGVAWYRKTLTLPPGSKGKKVFIEFDGIMSNSEVFLNKSLLGSRPNGYVPLRYDLTDALNYGGPNLLAVRADTSRQPASRWYTGAGINRHVRLVMQEPVHLEHASTFVSISKIEKDKATVRIEATIVNQSNEPRFAALNLSWLSNENVFPANVSTPSQNIPAGKSATFSQDITIPRPHLWTVDDPFMHVAQINVWLSGKTPDQPGAAVDSDSIPFGIRTAEFKPDTGFWLNGVNIKLKGVCLHSDVGALGTAVPASAWETRLRELKKYGVNAIRTAHNPMPPEFYDATDRLGFLVMDELFDVWTIGKEPADYHLYFKDWWQKDLDAVIQRDRNHPSIVMWSLGNEIWDILPQNPDPAADQFVGPNRSIDLAKSIFAQLRERTHQLDPLESGGRPVTVAEMRPNVAGAYTNGFADMMDVIGQNYRDNELVAAHTQNPARKIVGTESYKTREAWLAMRDNPAYSGQFLWAGVDYLGESGAWPNVVSPSGILDRTNFPKGEALEREAWWAPADKPVVHIARIVNIPTRPGRPNVNMGFANWTPADSTPHNENVAVYSNCEAVELFLNDTSLGSKPKDPADNARTWQVPYAAGTIKAVAKNKNAIVASEELKTAGPAVKIILTAERQTLPHDFDDVVYVRATVTDANGIPNPNASLRIDFRTTSPGKIVAVDNGDITSHEGFGSFSITPGSPSVELAIGPGISLSQRTAYQGSCIAIVRATADTGDFKLTASAEGLAPASVTIKAAPAAR